MKIGTCYIVKNEAEDLRKSLESVRSAADEIVVVDTGSEDHTVDVAKSFGAKIFFYQWKDDFADARNFALEQAQSPWIIFLDADEAFLHPREVRPALEEYLKTFPDGYAFTVTRYDIDPDYPGKSMGSGINLRIFRNLPELRYAGRIHECLSRSDSKKIKLVPTDERLAISHTGYAVSRQKKKAARNLELLKKDIEAGGGIPNPFQNGYLSDAYYVMGEYAKSLECALLALESGERFLGQLSTRYYVALKAMEKLNMLPEERLSLAKLAAQDMPDMPEFYREQGMILKSMGRLDEAKELLTRAAHIYLDHPENNREALHFSDEVLAVVYKELGEICHLQGDDNGAEMYFRQFRCIQSGDGAVLENTQKDSEKMEGKVLLSACYIVRNEADNLMQSLESLRGDADELIVVDTGSEDATIAVARAYDAKVLSFPWIGDFSAVRNFALEHAKGEWVLFLDADEYFTLETRGRVRQVLGEYSRGNLLMVFLKNFDKDTGEFLLDTYVPRIFRNRKDFRYEGRIHEELRQNGEEIQGITTVPKEELALIHTGYSGSVNRKKAERNLALLLEELKTSKHPERLYMYLAEACDGVEDEEQAMFYAEKDIETGRKPVVYASRSYRILLRLLAKRTNESDRRMQAAAWAVRDFPEIPEFHAEYGECLAQHGRFREAVEELDRAEQCMEQTEGWEPVLFPEEMRPMLKERRKLFMTRLEATGRAEGQEPLQAMPPSSALKGRETKKNVRISACVIAKDEEDNLPLWLESMGEIADELVVVDTGSADSTVQLAESAGARVEHFNWINDFSAAKNYAISKAKGDWILFLDADEYFPKEHRSLVRDSIEKYRMHPRVTELVFLRVNIEKETGRNQGTSMYVTRCFRNCEWLRYKGRIHENLTDISGRGRQVKQYVDGAIIYHTGYSDAVVRDKLRRNLFFLQEKEARGELEPLDAFYFADCHYGLGEYGKAADYARKAIEDGVEPVGLEERPYSILAQSLMKLKRPREELREAFGAATEKFPSDGRFYMLWGISDREYGDDDGAEEHFRQGRELYQRAKQESPFKASQMTIFLPTACFSLGEFAIKKGRIQEAAAYLIEGLQLNNRNARALRLLWELLKDGPGEEIVSLLEEIYDRQKDGKFLSEALGGTELWEIWRKR